MKYISLVLLFMANMAFSNAIDIHQFSSDQDEARYRQMIDELRCPKCQNQNLSGSNSPIAKDLRQELFRLIGEGKSEGEIKDFMVARYGNFVLYEPPVDNNTLVLWFSPLILLAIALVFVFAYRKKQAQVQSLSGDEAAALERILTQYKK